MTRVPEFQAPTGTFDVLPPQSARYERLIALYAQHVERAGYGLVAHLDPDIARRLRTAIRDALAEIGEATD